MYMEIFIIKTEDTANVHEESYNNDWRYYNVHEDFYNNDNNNKNDSNIFIWPSPSFSAHLLEHLSPAPFLKEK